jgi:hypothetical protein
MELLIACGMTLFGVAFVFIIPRYIRYSDRLNARKREEAINRRWAK